MSNLVFNHRYGLNTNTDLTITLPRKSLIILHLVKFVDNKFSL